jgi:glutamyl-tRNA reductase
VDILLVGTSFRDISLQDLSLLEKKTDEIRQAISLPEVADSGIEGCVLVSTCNRFEVYAETERPEESAQFILEKISECTGLNGSEIKVRKSDEAATHLFRVSAGLESMIVGEVEIAGQVKRSLSQSQQLGQTSRITEALFQRAAEVSKRVASDTGLGSAGRTLITGALDIVKAQGFDLSGKIALVIGTGAYARVVTSALERESVAEILTYSNSGRAEIFAQSHGTTPITTGGFAQALNKCDVIVACSGTHGLVISREQISELTKTLIPIVDLSLGSDVEPSVATLTNVMLVDLEEIYRSAPVEHHETIAHAENLIENSVAQFKQDLLARRNDPLVRLLREHVEHIVDSEVARVRNKSGDELADQVSRSLHHVTKTIFHKPTTAVREGAQINEIDDYQKAIKILFGLNAGSVDV